MSEYFRKYIKKEHYPNPPYPNLYQAKTLNSKPPFVTVSLRHSTIVSGRKLMAMIGTSCGVKKNKLTGSSKNIDLHREVRLITFEDGVSYARKICLVKISRSSREPLISKEIVESRTSTIFCLQLSCYPVNMSFFTRSSNVISIMTKYCGS